MSTHVIAMDEQPDGVRVSCSCGMRWPNAWQDREQAELFGNTHLGYVEEIAALASDVVPVDGGDE